MSAQRLSDSYRTAFVTGASSGLGRAFVSMLLAEGLRVWGTARDPARLAGFEPAENFTAVTLDLDRQAECESAFDGAAGQAGGSFDLVVQNAGYGVCSPFASTPFAVWQQQWESMLISTGRISHAAFSRMLARDRGCLVHVSSLAVDFPLPFMSGYNVAKAGLSSLSESLMQEAKGSRVKVIDFRPGDYRTGFNLAMRGQNAEGGERMERVLKTLDDNVNAAPLPERAATDLRRALLGKRSGIVRSGSIFQARIAPLLSSLAPASWRRAAMALYFRSG
ncbi:MAG: SDR family NAD(P)-dependent oxidoreductase [Opitutaceae bacterium]|jgi:NAD(P)-dependent dehydrogenase (short-subunit alcohol dehydrogenase family)